jgi:hypothetical protein
MKPEPFPILLALLAAVFGTAAAAGTVVNEPEAGVSLDVWHTAPLLQEPPRPCLAWHHQGAALLVPRGDLESLVTSRPSRWQSEKERQALIDGDAAAWLLASAAPAGDSLGCETLPDTLTGDGQALLLRRIRLGRAAVVETHGGRTLPSLRLRYLGDRCGPLCGHGEILIHLPGRDHPWLMLPWWRS